MILLFDEDRGFRQGVARSLRERGHRVAELDSSQQLASLDEVGRLTAVVLAPNSAASQPLQLADRLHADHPGVPVVITTTDRNFAAEPEVHSRDFVYCFCKPLSSGALSRVVDLLVPSAGRQ